MDQLGVDQVYIDKASGKNTSRPKLQNLLEFVRKGDTVIVESISRFARNTRDLLNLVEQLTAKGVEFVSQKEAIDTTTPTGKFMLTIFGAVAELERTYLLQRQREGIAAAKVQGKYAGRKPVAHPDFDRIVRQWKAGQCTAAEAMTIVNRTLDRHPDADHFLDDMVVWPDNPKTAWYYEQVQEATNSHEYVMKTDKDQNRYEDWTKLLEIRDWSELEKTWSEAHAG